MSVRQRSEGTLGARVRGLRAYLDRWLFPAGPGATTKLGGWKRALALVALVALAIILQLLRIGPDNALNSLWAEDGQILLQGALTGGFWHTVFITYAGYLILVPRLIAEVANLFPLADIPAAIAILSAAVVALSGLAIWFASAAHIRNPYLRGTLVALTVLSPVASLESVASASYVIWYMLFATFWLLLWRPATTRGALLGGLFVLLTALSTPTVWFFAPLAGLRAIAWRDRRDAIVLGAYAIGAAVQVPFVLANKEEAVDPLWTSDIWTAFVQRVVDGAALGERLGGRAWEHLGWPFLIVLLLASVAALVYGALRSSPTVRVFAVVAIPTSLAMFVISAYQRAVGTQMLWPAHAHVAGGGRYAIVPALLLVSVALVLVDRLSWRPGSRAATWLTTAVVAVFALGAAASFYVANDTARGTPAWDEALESAAATCLPGGEPEAVVHTSPEGFGVVLPCKRLISFSDGHAAR